MRISGHDEPGLRAMRRRIDEAEATSNALRAFARAHAGAAEAIHEAVIAMLAADGLAALATVIGRDWPYLLEVDACAFAWVRAGRAFAADGIGLREIEPRLALRMAGLAHPATICGVGRGHPLFGPAAPAIRAEALIALEGETGTGLLAIGQRAGESSATPAGMRLLAFLGRATTAMLERCPLP